VDRRVFVDLAERRSQLIDERERQRVSPIGPVQHDRRDGPLAFVDDAGAH
jgi:hypothetical protein